MSLLSALGVSLSSPASIAVTVIEFILGLVAGFLLFKGLKYILGFFLVLIIGDLLNIWSLSSLNVKSLVGGNVNVTAVEQAIKSIGPYLAVLQPIFGSVVVLIGFIIGAAIAFLR